MTDIQHTQIMQRRRAGQSYASIAKELNISINSVKSFCRRNANNQEKIENDKPKGICENCGKRLKQLPHRKRKRFCCDKSKSVEEIRQSLYSTVDLEQKQKAVYEEMTELSKSAADYAAQNAVNPSTQEDYVEKYNKMVEHYQEVKAQYEELSKEIQHRRAGDQLIINFKKTLLKQGVVTEFDENLWGALIDNVTAYTDDNIVFTFRDGTEVKVGK